MPPNGKLGSPQRETLTRWIAMGLPWPASDSNPSASAPARNQDRRRGSGLLVIPAVATTGRAERERRRLGLQLGRSIHLRPTERPRADTGPPQSREALIRRLTFDLWGLPPHRPKSTPLWPTREPMLMKAWSTASSPARALW